MPAAGGRQDKCHEKQYNRGIGLFLQRGFREEYRTEEMIMLKKVLQCISPGRNICGAWRMIRATVRKRKRLYIRRISAACFVRSVLYDA